MKKYNNDQNIIDKKSQYKYDEYYREQKLTRII